MRAFIHFPRFNNEAICCSHSHFHNVRSWLLFWLFWSLLYVFIFLCIHDSFSICFHSKRFARPLFSSNILTKSLLHTSLEASFGCSHGEVIPPAAEKTTLMKFYSLCVRIVLSRQMSEVKNQSLSLLTHQNYPWTSLSA